MASDLMSATGARPSRPASATLLNTVTRRSLKVSAASGVTCPPGLRATLDPISRVRASVSVMMSNAFISSPETSASSAAHVSLSRVNATAAPSVLIDQDELSARIAAVAQEIRQDFPTGQLHFICVLKGAFLFL